MHKLSHSGVKPHALRRVRAGAHDALAPQAAQARALGREAPRVRRLREALLREVSREALARSAAARGPTAAARDPTAAARDPTAAARDPTAAARDPTAAARGPTAAARGPTAAARGPTAAARDPTAAARGPTAAAREPTAAARDPTACCRRYNLVAHSKAHEASDAPAQRDVPRRRLFRCTFCPERFERRWAIPHALCVDEVIH